MNCPDCGGSSTVEIVSIALAGLAFIVSFMSLWLTSLRWPSVEVEHLESDADLMEGGMTGDMPVLHRLMLSIFIYNTGAAATVVRYFEAEAFREHNAGMPLFYAVEPPAIPNLESPLVLERDDAKPGRFKLGLEAYPITDPAEYARRLATLDSVGITLRWTYRGRRVPYVWRRRWITRHLHLTIPGAPFRTRVVRLWRQSDHTAHLADIAEGRKPA